MGFPHSAPLFTWKGMHSWAVGSRAPGLCKLFVKAKTPAKIRIARLVKRRREGSKASGFAHWEENGRKKQSIQCSTLGNCLSNCIKAGSNNTDLATPECISDYQKVKLRYGLGCAPNTVQLGSTTGERFDRQCSTDSQTESAASSSGSYKLIGSPSVLSSKLKGTCTWIVNAAQQNTPSLSDLVVGNQFLMHVTAAPVPRTDRAQLHPSPGLVNGSRKQRDSDIRDRILFFK
eukprot:c21285_g1_i1 orf=575-1270(-)